MMKKILLFASACLIVMGGIAQTRQYSVPKGVKEYSVKTSVQTADNGTRTPAMPVNASKSPAATLANDQEMEVGTTYYDLQSNSALSNRFFRYSDGEMGATWTGGLQATAFADRGSFYNFFDGTAWTLAGNTRIESSRRGWPTYAQFGEDGEAIISHTPCALFVRETRGEGDWVEKANPISNTDNTWPRMCYANGSLHILEGFQDDNANYHQGVFYSRTNDGVTFDPQGVQLEEIGPDYYSVTAFGADDYVWAEPHNGVIAFALFSHIADLVVMKSTDNGETWEKFVVWEHPIPMFSWEESIGVGLYTDTCVAPNGSGALVIDDEGKVHVTFCTNASVFSEYGGSYSYYPNWGHVMYWNEDLDTFTGNENQYEALDPTYHEEYFEDGRIIQYLGFDFDGDYSYITTGAETYYRTAGPNNMVTMSQVAPDRLAVAFMAADERRWTAGEDGTTYMVKQIFLCTIKYDPDMLGWYFDPEWVDATTGDMVTTTPGLDYSGFYRVNSSYLLAYDDCIYPQILSQNADDGRAQIYVFFQHDSSPGLALDGEVQTTYTENYIKMWTNNVELSGSVFPEPWFPNAIEDVATVVSMEIYPNPATGMVNVTVENAGICQIYNITGQVVVNANLKAGANLISISNLKTGVYFVSANGETQKLVVK